MARQLTWGIFTQGPTAVAAAAQDEFDMLTTYRTNIGLARQRGVTITRMIARLVIRPAVPGAAGIEDFHAGCLVLAGGAATSINPKIDNANYFWWTGGGLPIEGYESGAGIFGAKTTVIDIDVASQRVMRSPEESPFFIIRNDGADSFTYHFAGRLLMRLP